MLTQCASSRDPLMQVSLILTCEGGKGVTRVLRGGCNCALEPTHLFLLSIASSGASRIGCLSSSQFNRMAREYQEYRSKVLAEHTRTRRTNDGEGERRPEQWQ